MNIKKIALGLLISLFFSSFLVAPYAAKIDSISVTKKKIADLVKNHCIRTPYIERKVNLFGSVLDYCYQERFKLESLSGNVLLGAVVRDYIVKDRFMDSIELNMVDNCALCNISSYDELLYNVAVLYLSYKDLSGPSGFSRYCMSVQRLSDSYVHMGWFHSPEEVEASKIKDQMEQKKLDDARVEELLDERIWFRGVALEPLLSEFKPSVLSRFCMNRRGTPFVVARTVATVRSKPQEVETRERVASLPSCCVAASVNRRCSNKSDTSDGDLDDAFPTPSDFLAELSRYSASGDPASLPCRSVSGKYVPSLSEEERERFGREMFQNPPKN